MNQGTFLVDAFLIDVGRPDERRFRIKEPLHTGRSYQIVLAEDTHLDDKLVCVKSILYDTDRLDDRAYVEGRRKALRDEMEFLTLRSPLLPEPLDWIETADGPTSFGPEPLLVYEYQHGATLYDLVRERHPTGLAPLRALRMVAEIARFLGDIHEAGWVFRDLDPRHVIVGLDDILHITGCGNATKMGERPNEAKTDLNLAYVAPEARHERSGQFLRRAADIYALGALFSFMLTGEEPRDSPENPLTREAFERLSNVDPPGISLIVARCIQPLAKKRFNHVRRLLPYLDPDNLPTPHTQDFGLIMLPAPWSGAENPETNRALRSQISAGPLISVDEPAAPKPATEPAQAVEIVGEVDVEPPSRKRLYIGLAIGAALAIAAGLAAIFGSGAV